MRWKPGRRSRNIEDRRGRRARRPGFPFPLGRGGMSGGGGGMRIPLPRAGGGKIGLGTIVVFAAIFFLMRSNPDLLAGGGQVGVPMPGGAGGDVSAPYSGSPEEEERVQFVSFVLDDVQDTWQRLLPGYQDARLVLFSGAVRSACGPGQAASGPFYCPADQKAYIDLSFFDELHRRFGAPGDFAQAYVLAHEIGHHIQRLDGTEPAVRRAQQRSPSEANQLSVRMELQADCLAGVWGHSAERRGILEAGDLEEGLRAAAAIGDDRIQRMSQGRVHPESWTHGSSEQRVRWFRRGFESGDPAACDTFDGARL